MFRRVQIPIVRILLTGGAVLATGCGPSQLPADSITHELPIVTHWSNTLQSFEYLASDAVEFSVPYPEGDYVPGDCYPRYRIRTDIYPQLDRYIGTDYSTTQIPDGDAEKFAEEVREKTGVGLKFLRPDALESGRLISEPGFVQVLHGRVIRSNENDPGSLATIFLPSNWSEDAPAGTYPIVANGMYDLNDQVFYRVAHAMGGRLLAPFIAESSTGSRTGAIGVLWNGGGAEATFTLNEQAFRQFGALIDFVAGTFGGDRERILVGGNSRGGSTTVTLASNPLKLNYTVTFAAASSAMAVWGSGPRLASPTYAKQLNNLARVTGLRDAWRAGWRYPDCANPELAGLTAHEATSRILTGRSDVTEIDETWSPASPGFVQRLKEEGTQLYLEISGHDTIPFVKQLEYARTLQAEAIPVHVDVLLRQGHSPRYVDGEPFIMTQIWEALLQYVDPEVPGTPAVVPGTDFYRVNRSSGQLEPFTPPDGLFPFTMDAPHALARSQRFPIVMVGEPGTDFDLRVISEDNASPVLTLSGTIPSDSPARPAVIRWLQWPDSAAAGRYRYELQLRKPGATAWKTVPDTNTPAGERERAVLVVWEEEPNISGEQLARRYARETPSLKDYRGTIWGLSEY